jgi:iron complex outermembrane recepter protein
MSLSQHRTTAVKRLTIGTGSFMRLSIAVGVACLTFVGLCSAAGSWATVTKETNIPAQGLGPALDLLAREFNVQIVFVSEDVNHLRTQGAIGKLNAEQALKELLIGTGRTFKYLDDKTVTIVSDGRTPKPVAFSTFSGLDNPRLAQAQTNPIAGQSDSTAAVAVPGKSADESHDSLGEILVTATKRSENLNKVPISIAALTPEAMAESGVKGFRDVAAIVPGIEFDSVTNWGPNLTNIAIRGVNSTIGTSTTGIYLDDTPIQSRVQSFSYIGQPLPFTWDLERVEVDRGPQGTLFGAGAEGGAVRFIPTAPSLTQTSGLTHSEVSETKDGGWSYEAGMAAGGPLIDDTVGGRISLWYRKDGGYVNRVDPFTGDTVDANSNYSESKAARLAIVYRPTDGVTITPSISYQSQESHDTSTFYEYLSNPQQGDFENGRLLRQPSTDSLYLPSVKVETNLGFADLTSVSSYYHREASTLFDNTNLVGALLGGYGNPLGPSYPTNYSEAAPGFINLKQSFISQELRLTSADVQAPVSWVAGLFYSRVRQEDSEAIDTPYFATALATTNPVLYTDQGIVDTQLAAFGQVDYRATERLKLTAGLRVADVKYDADQIVSGYLNEGVPPVATGESRETPVTPKVGASFQYDDNNLFYVSIGKGYRVGGVNTPLANYCTGTGPAPKTYNSDSVWSYEIGAKDALFDGHLQVDTSVFHIDWKNIQQPVLIPSCDFEYFANLGAASVNGFDFALSALIGAHFKPALAVGYTDAHYTKTVMVNGVVTVDKGDTIGTVPQVPSPWNVTASTEYALDPMSDWRITLRLEDIFHSKNTGPYASYDPAAISYAPAITPNASTNVLNFRLSAEYRKFEVEAFVNNLLNSTPLLNRGQDSIASDLYYDTTLRPRTIGIGGYWHF